MTFGRFSKKLCKNTIFIAINKENFEWLGGSVGDVETCDLASYIKGHEWDGFTRMMVCHIC